jgi:TatD DNase family protein
MSLIDAHCHLANLNEAMPLPDILDEAQGQGSKLFLSSALRKSEVRYHLEHPDDRIRFSAGIHPNFEDCDLELRDIEALCASGKIWAVGEIGLDRGNHDLDWQLKTLTSQLDLARDYRLPVVLHLVGRVQEAYQVLKRYQLKYLVHGYAGSLQGFEQLSRLNAAFTISSRLLRPDKQDLLRAMVDHGAILFETDITQYYVKEGESNPLLRLLDLFRQVRERCMVSSEHLIYKQDKTFSHLTER